MKTVYRNWTIESKYKGDKYWDSSDTRFPNRNNHVVKVTNNITGKWTSFEYWESIKEKTIKTESRLMFAFYCFLTDAFAGNINDYFGFCNEFGYDAYSGSTKKIYKACQRAAEKVKRVMPGVLESGEVYNSIMNDLVENYGC